MVEKAEGVATQQAIEEEEQEYEVSSNDESTNNKEEPNAIFKEVKKEPIRRIMSQH